MDRFRIAVALGCFVLALACEGTQRTYPSCPPDAPPDSLVARNDAGVWDCATLADDCTWRYQDGAIWTGGPQKTAEGLWIWPDGTEARRQDLECRGVPTPDAGACGECSAPLTCDAESKQCVECVRDAHCPTDKVCDEQARRCIECLVQSDCPEGQRCKANDDNGRLNECVECLSNGDCDANGVCNLATNQCASCTSDDDCADKGFGSQCESGVCVQCGSNADCNGDVASSRCNVGAGTCGPCQNDTDCDAFPGQRSCIPGSRCVECDASTDCANNTNGETVCKLTAGGGSEPVNTCVECVVNGDCTDPAASRCLNNQCVPCRPANDVEDCHSVTAPGSATPLNVCDAGTCVQCTGTERGACNQNVCDSIAKTCTPFPAGSAGPCATCVSDAHCSTDGSEFCARQVFDGTDLGFFCFPAAQGNNCPFTGRPFVGLSTASIDNPSAALCVLRETSCPARLETGGTCSVDADCGAANVEDGFCVNAGGGLVCTIPCAADIDCPGTVTCLGTGRCGFE